MTEAQFDQQHVKACSVYDAAQNHSTKRSTQECGVRLFEKLKCSPHVVNLILAGSDYQRTATTDSQIFINLISIIWFVKAAACLFNHAKIFSALILNNF